MVVRFIIGLPAILTGSASLLLAAHGLFDPDARAAWVAAKLVSGAAVAVFSALTVLHLKGLGAGADWRSPLLAMGAPALVALGVVAICSAIYLAVVRGDWEYYVIVLGGAMVAQGLLMVFSLRSRVSPPRQANSS